MWQPLPIILAQAGGDGSTPATPSAPAGTTSAPSTGNAPGQTGEAPGAPGGQFMLIMMGLMVFMIIFSLMGGRKEKKKKAEMLSAMKKGDRVQTIGGILGTIVEVKADDVLLKVDENANTKIRFAKSAVQNVILSKPTKEQPADETAEKDAEAENAEREEAVTTA